MNLDKRSAEESEVGDNVCDQVDDIVTPRVAKNTRGKWHFIVNTEKKEYVQLVQVGLCQEKGSSCGGDLCRAGRGTVCR